jgi:hypothetical protein
MPEPSARSTAFPAPLTAAALLIGAVAIFVGLWNGYLTSYLDAVVIGLLGFALFMWIGTRMSTPADAKWLPAVVAAGFLVKLALSTGRYLVLVIYYNGSGDATGYHGSGYQLVDVWRSFEIPPEMGLGTSFVDGFTGLLYVPYLPTMIGGFFLYSSLAFAGQLLMYAAFRRSAEPQRLKWYAIALFFVPAVSYWPASIGKESLMFLGLGLAAYGAATMLDRGRTVAILALVAGLGLAGAIRSHVAALFIGSLVVAFVVAKANTGLRISASRRMVLTVVVMTTSLVGLWFAAGQFDINLDAGAAAGVDEFVDTIEGNTSKGGSEVSGGAVESPLDIPAATLRVLFRPLPLEAHNAPALASAIESAFILGLIVARLPWIVKNMLTIREQPYVLMCLVMVLGFVIMFSTFLNLGLLARQRSQILPFLAVVVIQLGWDSFAREATRTQIDKRDSEVSAGYVG